MSNKIPKDYDERPLMIDWQDIAQGYNDRYGTDFDVPGMLADAYRRFGSATMCGESLGVAKRSFVMKMHEHNIPMKLPGGREGPSTKQLLSRINPKTIACMSVAEIANDIGRSRDWTYQCLVSMGLRWKGCKEFVTGSVGR